MKYVDSKGGADGKRGDGKVAAARKRDNVIGAGMFSYGAMHNYDICSALLY